MLFDKVVMCSGSVKTIVSKKGLGFKAGDFLKINFNCPWNEGFIVLGFEEGKKGDRTMVGYSFENKKLYRISLKTIRRGMSSINHHFHISKLDIYSKKEKEKILKHVHELNKKRLEEKLLQSV